MPKASPKATPKTSQSANNFDRLFGASAGQQKTGGLLLLDRGRIQTGTQPRQTFPAGDLRDLAESIRSLRERGEGIEGTGILQPLLVAAGEDGNYRLIAGERRLRASGEAGLKQVPAVVVPLRADALLVTQLVENLQRADLPPLDEARALGRLIDEQGLSIRDAARALGKERGWVQNRVRLLKVASDVQAMIEQRPDSIPHAFDIESVSDSELRAALILETLEGASVAHIRRRLAQTLEPSAPISNVEPDNPHPTGQSANSKVSFQNDSQMDTKVDESLGAQSPDANQTDPVLLALQPANAFAAEAARLLKKATLSPDDRAEIGCQLDTLERTLSRLRKLAG